MKATGIVRRIDDLGRVVIPKEIRRTLRIREGDPLEIYTDKEGAIILKKYSPVGELSDFAVQYADSLYRTSGYITCIADRDNIIAISGASKKEYLEKQLSPELEKIINQRSTFIGKVQDGKSVPLIAGDGTPSKYSSQVITPIIAEGDVVGAVMMFSTEAGTNMGEVETKLTQSAATFLGKQLEQ